MQMCDARAPYDVVEPSFGTKAITEVKGRNLTELEAVRTLHKKGVQFQKERRQTEQGQSAKVITAMDYLEARMPVPAELKVFRLRGDVVLGNKTWGKIDFLVNHRGYTMLDQRA